MIAASFAACAALRLARFNVETGDEDEHLHFSGLPSPAAAAAIAGFAIMFYTLRQGRQRRCRLPRQIDTCLQTVLPFFAVLVALLMVSRIPYPHVVNQVFRGQRSFAPRGGRDFRLGGDHGDSRLFDPDHSAVFVFYGPVRLCWRKIVERRQQEDPLF